MRLGALLVQGGLLEPGQLEDAVAEQLRHIALGIFEWTDASYRFCEELPQPETIKIRVPTERLILDGVQEIGSWRRISRALGSWDTTYQTVKGNEELIRTVDLDTESLEILALLSHSKTVEELCQSNVLPDFEVCRRLWAFRALCWIEAAYGDSPGLEHPAAPGEPEVALDTDLEGLGLILGHDGTKQPG